MSDYLRDTQYVETNNVTCGDPSSGTASLKQPVDRSSSTVNVHRRVRANGQASERSSKNGIRVFSRTVNGKLLRTARAAYLKTRVQFPRRARAERCSGGRSLPAGDNVRSSRGLFAL